MVRKVDHECLDRFLPTDAFLKGFRLDWWAPEIDKADPVILTRIGCPGQELYRWNYNPSLIEVFEKCRELMEAVNG